MTDSGRKNGIGMTTDPVTMTEADTQRTITRTRITTAATTIDAATTINKATITDAARTLTARMTTNAMTNTMRRMDAAKTIGLPPITRVDRLNHATTIDDPKTSYKGTNTQRTTNEGPQTISSMQKLLELVP